VDGDEAPVGDSNVEELAPVPGADGDLYAPTRCRQPNGMPAAGADETQGGAGSNTTLTLRVEFLRQQYLGTGTVVGEGSGAGLKRRSGVNPRFAGLRPGIRREHSLRHGQSA
jgi:hypothetical protein